MNKVVCYASENRYKGQRTPVDAYGGNEDKWNQITQQLSHWDKGLQGKKNRFYQDQNDLQKRDFISSQLNDTRYMSVLALQYLKQLGADITTNKGVLTSWLRHQWGLDELIGNVREKDRVDHRHHAIDAVVIACMDRTLYRDMVSLAKDLERSRSELRMRDLHIDPPWLGLRNDLKQHLAAVIISHSVQRKLSGALHEETGVGFIEGIGNVERKPLNGAFKQVDKIYDDTVRDIVKTHLNKFNGNPKLAFAEGVTVLHRDGKTPIRRVRILQSKATLASNERSKFGVRDKEGEVFKWLAYGNYHHVEIFRNRSNGKYSSRYITTMEAHHRVKGIGMDKQAAINSVMGSGFDFVMALHINDLVSVKKGARREFYRIQVLEGPGKLVLRLQIAARLNDKSQGIRKSINTLMADYRLRKHNVNVIGKLVE
jgi:CRISPR-associated endonuclease Csn1